MGSTSSKNQKKEATAGAADSQGQQQVQNVPLLPPSVMTELPDPDLPISMLATSQTPDRSRTVLTTSTFEEAEVTFPESPNAIMASAIPEVYYASDMIHIDSPEPTLSIDLSVPSYVSPTGEISQAYPEPDPYINNYVELYGVPPPPPLDSPNGIRGDLPHFHLFLITLLIIFWFQQVRIITTPSPHPDFIPPLIPVPFPLPPRSEFQRFLCDHRWYQTSTTEKKDG